MTVEYGKLHQGLTYEQYDAEPGLRSSDLKLIKRSPAHWVEARRNPSPPTDALRFGQVFHMAIEHGKDFIARYKVEPEFTGRTKDGRESTRSAEALAKKEAWYADLPKDAVVVKREWLEPLQGMINAALGHRLVGNLLKNGVRETSLWVEDPETGVVLKCRPDFISEEGFVVDVKTTRDASPGFFKRQIFSDRNEGDPFYVLQAAHYAHCLRAAGIGRGESFVFIAIEKEAPYGIMVYPLDVGCLAPGEQWRSELTGRYAECRRTDTWPAYPEQAYPLVPPQYVSLPGGEE